MLGIVYNSNRQTHPVGGKTTNGNGLYDIHGSVWEWVQDKYADKLPGGVDPLNVNPDEPYYVIPWWWLGLQFNIHAIGLSQL